MPNLSGKVAVLNEAATVVVEVRDLGPEPVPVKIERVRPITINTPVYDPATEELFTYVDVIDLFLVTRTYQKRLINFATLDQGELNTILAAKGSVVRALGLIIFEEINKLRVRGGQTAYTMQQFVDALLLKMRSEQ